MLEPPAPPGDRRDHLLAGLAALGLLGLFVALQRGKISTYDSKIVLATARAISEGHLHLDPADDGYLRHVPYSHYGIGMSLAILPLYVLQQALHVSSDALVTLTSPLLLCASAALLYLCGRELRWSRGCRWLPRSSSAHWRWPCRSARTCLASQGWRSARRRWFSVSPAGGPATEAVPG